MSVSAEKDVFERMVDKVLAYRPKKKAKRKMKRKGRPIKKSSRGRSHGAK